MVSRGETFLFYCKLVFSFRVPKRVQMILPDGSESRVLCASCLRSEGMASFSDVVKVNTILSSMQFMPHRGSEVEHRHAPWHVALAGCSPTIPVTLGSP